jgi:3-oxoadipate enol-lactonase
VLVSANPFGWSEEVQAISAEEDELFDGARYDEAAELMVRAWVDGPKRGPDEVAPALRDRVRAMLLRAYELQAGVDASPRRVELDLSRIHEPVLVVRGDLDWPDVERAAARFVAELPDAREVVIEGVAHLPAIERPDELARVVLEFLDH